MFRVIWTATAFDLLEHILDLAADPNAVVAAVVELDHLLGTDPVGHSEDRPDDRRVAFVLPIGVMFDFDKATRTVTVGSVWTTRVT